MLADKTNIGLVLYNHTDFYRFEKTSSYWSVKRISVFLCFSLVSGDTLAASQCITVQLPISKTLYGPCIATIAGFFVLVDQI